MRRPAFVDVGTTPTSLHYTWLGHATNLVQIDGVNVITDPVWNERVSPISFTGPKRYRPPPARVDQLPPIDIAVISHNHYDHMDKPAIKELDAAFKSSKCTFSVVPFADNLHWFVPMGLRATLIDWGVSGERVTELSWGDVHEHTVARAATKHTVRMLCVPAQHWSQRGLTDRFKTLWSGWAVLGEHHRFYFAGDTGFCRDEFEKLGRLYGPFDLAAIPIGCYEPRLVVLCN